jgi:DNA-binding MarR family transcriptional regulator
VRWTERFLARGLVERRADRKDARGVLFALTADGAERVRRQLEAEKG